MPLTQANQIELGGSFLMGAGTDFRIGQRLDGLGTPDLKLSDLDLIVDGVYAGWDRLGARVVAIPVQSNPGTFQSAMQDWHLLLAAFSTTADTTLDMWLEGLPSSNSTFRFYGRARGAQPDMTLMRTGVMRALALFHAVDPFAYGPEQSAALGATITNAGTADSPRWSAAITGATNPAVAHENGLSVALTANGGYSGNVTITRAPMVRSIVDGSGNSQFTKIEPTSEFFELAVGAQDVTYTGGGSCTFTWRSAWR